MVVFEIRFTTVSYGIAGKVVHIDQLGLAFRLPFAPTAHAVRGSSATAGAAPEHERHTYGASAASLALIRSSLKLRTTFACQLLRIECVSDSRTCRSRGNSQKENKESVVTARVSRDSESLRAGA